MKDVTKEDIQKYVKDKEIVFAAQILALRTKEVSSSAYKGDPIITLAMQRLNDRISELNEKFMSEKRKVLFTDSMSNDAVIMITDAPKGCIEDLCRFVNEFYGETEKINQYYKDFKRDWYTKIIFDSYKDSTFYGFGEYENNVEVIGYDEVYNLSNYVSEEDC